MSVVGVIDHFATGTYTVTRTAAPTVVDGYAVAGASSTFQVVAVVVPLSGRDLQSLPEGLLATDSRKVITATQLRPTDVVTIDSEPWAVYGIDGPYTLRGGTHYNALVARQVTPGVP